MKFRLLLVILAFVASAHAAPPTRIAPLTRIVFVTDGKAQAAHGGFYEAVALGLYKQRGLDVKIRAGGPGVNVPQLLARGGADFAIGSNSFVALDMVRQGVPVRAIMAVFQKDPVGGGSYANLVLAPQRWIDKNPAAVQAFYDASRDGWRDYLDGDRSPANALIKRDNPDMNDAVIAQAIAKMKALVESGDAKPFGVGAMTDLRWRRFFESASARGLYPKDLPYQKAYDLSFMRNAPQYFE
jgi:ABC-type nitrate/sulfonate/bicarbonate transport system substrate-binding protein